MQIPPTIEQFMLEHIAERHPEYQWSVGWDPSRQAWWITVSNGVHHVRYIVSFFKFTVSESPTELLHETVDKMVQELQA